MQYSSSVIHDDIDYTLNLETDLDFSLFVLGFFLEIPENTKGKTLVNLTE